MATQIKPKEQKIIQQAQSLIAQNNAEAAKTILLKFTQNNKSSQFTRYYLSLCHAILGNLNEALNPTVNLVKKHGDNIEYLKLLGSIYHGLLAYEDAIIIFERALKLNNKDVQVLSNIASSLKESHQLEEARTYYERTLALQPNQPDALTNYGLLMQANAKIDEAITLHRKALQLSPNHHTALYNLAFSLHEKGDYNASIQVYLKVVEAMPHYVRGLCDTAHVFGKLKKHAEALPFLQRAAEISPEDEQVHLNFGITHRMMENFDLAETSFNEVIRLNSENHTAKYYLAIMKGDNSIDSSPDSYVQELFDGYAETFDEQLIDKLKYKTPSLIGDMVKKHTDASKKYDILDLGCGTGLAGIYLTELSKHMVGVDLSEKMLKKAEERNIYDEVITSSIDDYFESYNFLPNIVISADVFVYIGDLDNVFSAISNVIKNDGIFVFSTEDNPECKQFELRDSGRFAHNETYIRQLAKENHFTVIENIKIPLRQEMGKPINGQIYLLTTDK